MGKSGTGKSSLCNAIFQSHICATHPLNGCTRQAHRLTLQIGERRMTLVDLPGIGETPQHDQEYRALYRQLLPEVDLIIWILRADERAYAADITMHQFLLNEGAAPSRFLFVLSHADRAFPAEEWNATEKCPSRQQALSLATVTARVATLFPSSFPVLSVAAPVGWNLPAFVSLMIHALPPQATSAVYSHIRGENRSEQARKHAQQTFGETIGKSFDVAVARFSFPAWMLQLLRKARDRIIHLLITLWERLF
ncbi:GTPase [Escherichia coli]|nr:GTPase [Escherichia coli]EFK3056178.1 GTPase [Escherichia coli]HAL9139828.1 GTPase [Escherichia coli]HAL9264986.1 GTPase [Escherichia coli]HAL9352674.1 GTPase [Escherichia coli]